MFASSMNEPGTFVVTSSDKTQEVEADAYRYNERDELELVKDGQVVAMFRWWDSIIRKDS